MTERNPIRNKFFLISSRTLNKDEETAIRYHGTLDYFKKEYTILSPEDLPAEFVVFNITNIDCRKYIELNRSRILQHEHCFVKSFHEDRDASWIADFGAGPNQNAKLPPVLSTIHFVAETANFIDYLTSYSKITPPQSVTYWILSKLSRIFRMLVCSGEKSR